jgi:hypothetical protein
MAEGRKAVAPTSPVWAQLDALRRFFKRLVILGWYFDVCEPEPYAR